MAFFELWEPLRPEWEARGIVDLWPYDTGAYSICVYGRGIACRTGAGNWDEVRAPELGSIRAVSSHLALTETGVLLAAGCIEIDVIQLPIEWRKVTSSEPVVRLASGSAFGASGLWLRETGGVFSSCMQRPALVAGTPPRDALDAMGRPIPAKRYRRITSTKPANGRELSRARYWASPTSAAVSLKTGWCSLRSGSWRCTACRSARSTDCGYENTPCRAK